MRKQLVIIGEVSLFSNESRSRPRRYQPHAPYQAGGRDLGDTASRSHHSGGRRVHEYRGAGAAVTEKPRTIQVIRADKVVSCACELD
ncbi:MAG: hypothetical protein H6Q31_2247 [Bacteroidetes bacterium]|nr:hypothetical protein [Bacteroidota bacterium]